MANEKELIRQLFKIAQNQQKIINKLAGFDLDQPVMTEALQGMLDKQVNQQPGNRKFFIQRAVISSDMAAGAQGGGKLHLTISCPPDQQAALDSFQAVLSRNLGSMTFYDTQAKPVKASSVVIDPAGSSQSL